MEPILLSPFTLAKNSAKPIKGLFGVLGEFRETTEGEVNEAGASTVKVRSSDVKFEA